jgi:GR25 family glycosyltransferase involved in LPS biosynthesis
MWTEYFDRIIVINLKKRLDRLAHITEELKKYDIPFTLFEALEFENGRYGLYQTMKQIFLDSIERGDENVLLFEDDAKFLNHPNKYMPDCIAQLPDNWLQLYLGISTKKDKGLSGRQAENLLRVDEAYSTHAVAYSKEAMNLFLKSPMILPIDNMMVQKLQPLGRSYCTFPIVCTQLASYSDIEKKFTDWSRIIENRFYENVNQSELKWKKN